MPRLTGAERHHVALIVDRYLTLLFEPAVFEAFYRIDDLVAHPQAYPINGVDTLRYEEYALEDNKDVLIVGGGAGLSKVTWDNGPVFSEIDWSMPYQGIGNVKVRDVDYDGDADIIALLSDMQTFKVLLQDNAGDFQEMWTITALDHVQDYDVLDFFLDPNGPTYAYRQLVVMNNDALNVHTINDGVVRVGYNARRPDLNAITVLREAGPYSQDEVLWATPASANPAIDNQILLRIHQGGFEVEDVVTDHVIANMRGADLWAGTSDVVLSLQGESSFWFMYDLDFSFDAPATWELSYAPAPPVKAWTGFLLSDFDNDGNPDLLVANEDQESVLSYIGPFPAGDADYIFSDDRAIVPGQTCMEHDAGLGFHHIFAQAYFADLEARKASGAEWEIETFVLQQQQDETRADPVVLSYCSDSLQAFAPAQTSSDIIQQGLEGPVTPSQNSNPAFFHYYRLVRRAPNDDIMEAGPALVGAYCDGFGIARDWVEDKKEDEWSEGLDQVDFCGTGGGRHTGHAGQRRGPRLPPNLGWINYETAPCHNAPEAKHHGT